MAKIFNIIGRLSQDKNQFKLFRMLMNFGIRNPNEITSVCATVIYGLAAVYDLPEEQFKEVIAEMQKKYEEVKDDLVLKQEMKSVFGVDD